MNKCIVTNSANCVKNEKKLLRCFTVLSLVIIM